MNAYLSCFQVTCEFSAVLIRKHEVWVNYGVRHTSTPKGGVYIYIICIYIYIYRNTSIFVVEILQVADNSASLLTFSLFFKWNARGKGVVILI